MQNRARCRGSKDPWSRHTRSHRMSRTWDISAALTATGSNRRTRENRAGVGAPAHRSRCCRQLSAYAGGESGRSVGFAVSAVRASRPRRRGGAGRGGAGRGSCPAPYPRSRDYAASSAAFALFTVVALRPGPPTGQSAGPHSRSGQSSHSQEQPRPAHRPQAWPVSHAWQGWQARRVIGRQRQSRVGCHGPAQPNRPSWPRTGTSGARREVPGRRWGAVRASTGVRPGRAGRCRAGPGARPGACGGTWRRRWRRGPGLPRGAGRA